MCIAASCVFLCAVCSQGYRLQGQWYCGALVLEKVALACIALFMPPSVRRVVPLSLAAAVIVGFSVAPLAFRVHYSAVDTGMDLVSR